MFEWKLSRPKVRYKFSQLTKFEMETQQFLVHKTVDFSNRFVSFAKCIFILRLFAKIRF